jgi:flagellar basal-body rod modification protein FlgD
MPTIDSVVSASATTPTAPPKDNTAIDQDTFMKLLVAQLKYQDPSNPTDPSQFLSQTAQFTEVEKLGALSTLSQQVLDATTSQSATSMVGRTVTFKDVAGATHTGQVSAVSLGAKMPNLTIDGVSVPFDSITEVSVTPTPAATA